VRHLKALSSQTVLLFEDETPVRLFPVLRRAWSRRGEQGRVLISGRNAKRILLGVINPRTGHRLTARSPNMRQEHFQSFLRLLRHHYRDRPLALLLDEGPNHTAQRSLALAVRLNIDLIWLPKQCSELNAMDQLWRGVKQEISANVQFKNIDAHAAFAEAWAHSLTPTEALRKASVLSEDFWLKDRWT
jgi:DDE superfamily endonuclease